MALTRGFIRNAATAPLDARLMDAARLVGNADGSVRAGVLDGDGRALVSATATMNVTIGAADFVTTKGAADGAAVFTNDGDVTLAIAAAPASNSRIDVIWVKHNDDTTGDANALPTFGVTSGAAAATPAKPSIPVGALELATLRIYAGTTATNGGSNVLTNTYQMTAARGGLVPFRTKTELDAWTNPLAGQRALVLATGKTYTRSGTPTAWRPTTLIATAKTGTVVLTASTLTTAVTLTLPDDAPAGDYRIDYSIMTDAGSVGSRYHRPTWAGADLTAYTADYVSNAPAGGQVAADTLVKTGHPGGGAVVALAVQVNASGPAFRYARLTVTYVGP